MNTPWPNIGLYGGWQALAWLCVSYYICKYVDNEGQMSHTQQEIKATILPALMHDNI